MPDQNAEKTCRIRIKHDPEPLTAEELKKALLEVVDNESRND